MQLWMMLMMPAYAKLFMALSDNDDAVVMNAMLILLEVHVDALCCVCIELCAALSDASAMRMDANSAGDICRA